MYICVRILYSMTGVLEEKARRREREIRKWRKKQIWRELLIIWFPNFNLSIKIISRNFVFPAVLFVLVPILISIFVKPISSFSSAKTSYFLKPVGSFLKLYSLLSIQICYSQTLIFQKTALSGVRYLSFHLLVRISAGRELVFGLLLWFLKRVIFIITLL